MEQKILLEIENEESPGVLFQKGHQYNLQFFYQGVNFNAATFSLTGNEYEFRMFYKNKVIYLYLKKVEEKRYEGIIKQMRKTGLTEEIIFIKRVIMTNKWEI